MKLAKRKAAAEGRTLTSLIEDGVRLVLLSGEKTKKRRRVVLPVSKAMGGPMPGIDISDSAALQEKEDLDYMERLNPRL